MRAADEIWVTSSTKEVLAIVTLDGKPVGDGQARAGVPPHARALPGLQAHGDACRPGARRRLGMDVDAQVALIEYPCEFPIKVMGRRRPASRRR